MAKAVFNIVLLHPQIPNNTGNIGRTAAATGCRLHLIHPLGFEMTEKARRRAGLDYWDLLDCCEHEDWDSFLATEKPKRVWLFTTHSPRPYWDAQLTKGDYLLFGNETAGVPDSVHDWIIQHQGEDYRLTLPMVADPRARSLNLATVVCAAVYEGLRQTAVSDVHYLE